MIRRPPRSTLFPTRRSSDLVAADAEIEGRRGVRRHDEDQRRRVGDEVLEQRFVRRQPPGDVAQRTLCARHSARRRRRSEEHTSELQSLAYLVCRLLLDTKKK